jgi:hypothetical protein
MTVGKASALAAGFAGAVALGVAIGPMVKDKWSTTPAPSAVVTESAPDSAPAAAKTRARRPATAPARSREVRADISGESRPALSNPRGSVRSVKVDVWEPELRDRVKKVLNPGTRLELAAENFETPAEFVTVAHAARNTSVPFVVLKHRVLNEGQTLAEAIHEFKPNLDAKAEVARARAEAQADLAVLSN